MPPTRHQLLSTSLASSLAKRSPFWGSRSSTVAASVVGFVAAVILVVVAMGCLINCIRQRRWNSGRKKPSKYWPRGRFDQTGDEETGNRLATTTDAPTKKSKSKPAETSATAMTASETASLFGDWVCQTPSSMMKAPDKSTAAGSVPEPNMHLQPSFPTHASTSAPIASSKARKERLEYQAVAPPTLMDRSSPPSGLDMTTALRAGSPESVRSYQSESRLLQIQKVGPRSEKPKPKPRLHRAKSKPLPPPPPRTRSIAEAIVSRHLLAKPAPPPTTIARQDQPLAARQLADERVKKSRPTSERTMFEEDGIVRVVKKPVAHVVHARRVDAHAAATRFPIKVFSATAVPEPNPKPTQMPYSRAPAKSSLRTRNRAPLAAVMQPGQTERPSTPPQPSDQMSSSLQGGSPPSSFSQTRGEPKKKLSIDTAIQRKPRSILKKPTPPSYDQQTHQNQLQLQQQQPGNPAVSNIYEAVVRSRRESFGGTGPTMRPMSRYNPYSLYSQTAQEGQSIPRSNPTPASRFGPRLDAVSPVSVAAPANPHTDVPSLKPQQPASTSVASPGPVSSTYPSPLSAQTQSSRPSYLPGYYFEGEPTPLTYSAVSNLSSGPMNSGFGTPLPPLPLNWAPQSAQLPPPHEYPQTPLSAPSHIDAGRLVQTQAQLPSVTGSAPGDNPSGTASSAPRRPNPDIDREMKHQHRRSRDSATTIESYSTFETTPPENIDPFFNNPQQVLQQRRQQQHQQEQHQQQQRQQQQERVYHVKINTSTQPVASSPSAMQPPSPISQIRYPKIPRSTNQAVPRSSPVVSPLSPTTPSTSNKQITPPPKNPTRYYQQPSYEQPSTSPQADLSIGKAEAQTQAVNTTPRSPAKPALRSPPVSLEPILEKATPPSSSPSADASAAASPQEGDTTPRAGNVAAQDAAIDGVEATGQEVWAWTPRRNQEGDLLLF